MQQPSASQRLGDTVGHAQPSTPQHAPLDSLMLLHSLLLGEQLTSLVFLISAEVTSLKPYWLSTPTRSAWLQVCLETCFFFFFLCFFFFPSSRSATFISNIKLSSSLTPASPKFSPSPFSLSKRSSHRRQLRFDLDLLFTLALLLFLFRLSSRSPPTTPSARRRFLSQSRAGSNFTSCTLVTFLSDPHSVTSSS